MSKKNVSMLSADFAKRVIKVKYPHSLYAAWPSEFIFLVLLLSVQTYLHYYFQKFKKVEGKLVHFQESNFVKIVLLPWEQILSF